MQIADHPTIARQLGRRDRAITRRNKRIAAESPELGTRVADSVGSARENITGSEKPMNLGDLTSLVEKPIAAVSDLLNTPNSAGRYRPFYLRNLLDAVQGRTLDDAVDDTITLITGGSSGIGEAAAKKIAEAGGEVVLVARTRENLEKVAAEIRGNGGTAHVYPCDLTDMDAIATMADQVLADLGGVDILINNAGRSIRRSLELSYDRIHDYQRTM
jgi:hypothetical protein